ncbi:MAG: ribonuclease P protein component [Halieaceae bacterium]
MDDFSFTRKDRLLDASAYSRVFDGAETKASHKHLLLLAISNDLGHHRLGLIVAKKNIRLAVQRNRFKRIAREFFRQCPESRQGMDVIVMARKGADLLDNHSLSTILRQQWLKLSSKATP